jgi:lysyl-tRNA synthetase, class II
MVSNKISSSSVETQRQLRIEKMNKLKEIGHDPFTPDSKRDYVLKEVKDRYEELKSNSKDFVTLAGRIKSKRVSGKIAFCTIEDESLPDGFQFILKQDELPEIGNYEGKLTFQDFKDLFDEGDFIQGTGYLQFSSTMEPSLFLNELKILTKSLRPLPEKIEDIEQKYRQRYVDMRLNPEVRDLFVQKSKFWQASREFMIENGFLEIQMPTMEETTGGAEANPFVTHHNALDEDFYLRISSELHQKRMIVAGFEKVFDLEKNYRNEGIDDEHLQEYYQIEFYWAYTNYKDLIIFTEKLFQKAIQAAFGTLILDYKGKAIDWSGNYPQIAYYDFVEKYANIKLSDYDTVEKLRELAISLNLKYEESDGKGRLIDLIYKKTARPKCIEPVWLIDHPVDISPLSKRKPEKPNLTQRMQLIAYGSELCNGFSELNDPIDQLHRFEEQQSLREGGDDEAMMLDKDYINALEIGMPPTSGFGFSERVFSVLMQKPIRECTVFPLMRRQKENGGKTKHTYVAHALISNSENIPLWTKLNTAAHLSASFASRAGKKLIHIDKTYTQDELELPMNIQHAIIMKSATTSEEILRIFKEAKKKKLEVSIFTEDMKSSSNDELVNDRHSSKSQYQIEYLGVLIFGKKSDVEAITNDFPLFD